MYGQTGSGKTFTHDGITRAAAATIFGALDSNGRKLATVTLSVVEIYNEHIRCLLTGRDVTLRRAHQGKGVVLDGARERVSANGYSRGWGLQGMQCNAPPTGGWK
jgi:hypothetical protein